MMAICIDRCCRGLAQTCCLSTWLALVALLSSGFRQLPSYGLSSCPSDQQGMCNQLRQNPARLQVAYFNAFKAFNLRNFQVWFLGVQGDNLLQARITRIKQWTLKISSFHFFCCNLVACFSRPNPKLPVLRALCDNITYCLIAVLVIRCPPEKHFFVTRNNPWSLLILFILRPRNSFCILEALDHLRLER